MGDILGDATSNLGESFGFGNNSGNEAANEIQAANFSAIQELRRQFEITQGNIAPFLDAGTNALPGVVEGTTVEGLDARLKRIFDSDIFSSLVGERTRAVEGQLAATGQSRSGTALLEAARVPTDLGLLIEEIINGRATNLAGSGQNAAIGLGSLGANNSNLISKIIQNTGQAESDGILTDQQARAAGQKNLQDTISLIVGGFSDPRLKENVEKIGDINGLPIYQWDWIKGAKGTFIEKCMNIGFMANEVERKFPDFVYEYLGFKTIDYTGLLDNLEAA